MHLIGLLIIALLCALVFLKIFELKRGNKRIHIISHPEVPNTRCVACGLIVNRYDERNVCANCVAEGK